MSLRSKASMYAARTSRSPVEGRLGAVSRSMSARGACPAQCAVDRVRARLQEGRHLSGAPTEHVPQDEHRPLPGCKVLQRGDECQPHRLADTARSAGSPSRGRTKLSGAGWIQVASGRASPRRSSPAATGATSIGSARRPPLQHVDADVGGDPVEPRAQPARSSNLGSARQARSIVSWTASSASWIEPSIR